MVTGVSRAWFFYPMTMIDGWLKLHRKTLESAVFQNPNVFQCWAYCLMKSTHKTRRATIHGKPYDLKPGQFIFGRHTAAAAMSMKPSTVRDAMETLRRLECISIQPNHTQSIITVLNWHAYQGAETGAPAPLPTIKTPKPHDNKPDNPETPATDNQITGSGPLAAGIRQATRHQPNTNKNETKKQEPVKRGVAASGHELMLLEFVLRLTDDEFKMFTEQVRRTIQTENPRFIWDSVTGGFESDMRKLIYKTTDAKKINLLSDTYRLNGEKMNWAAYVLMGIRYTVRSARRVKITSAYLYTTSMLLKPAMLVGSAFDGKMRFGK